MATAKSGDKVRVHYTGTLEGDEIFDSSDGRDPLEFTLGSGNVIPGFEEAVLGMEVGDERKVTIPADQAYGPRNDAMIATIPKAQFPDHIDPQVGQQLQMTQGDRDIPVRITDVTDENVILDANHPLAGQDLTFALELVEIV